MADPLAPLRHRRIDNPVWNLGIIIAVPLVILLSLNISLQWGDKTTDSDGNVVYANKIALLGWSAVPFSGIASLLASCGALYTGYKVSKKDSPLRADSEINPSEETSESS